MNAWGRYEVTGRRQYRGHRPGEVFEARLDELAEARAIRRGDIRLLGRVDSLLEAGSYRLPRDWPPPAADATTTTEAPEGASLISGGGKRR